jgi:hypothetical protein
MRVTTSEAARLTLEHLRRHGWTRNGLHDEHGDCLIGAARKVLDDATVRRLARHVGKVIMEQYYPLTCSSGGITQIGAVENWNDCHTWEDVERVLEKVAAS